MDSTTETPTPSTDIELATTRAIELDTIRNDSGMGSEVTKTLALSAATSAVMFGGYAVISLLVPRVKRWIVSRKKAVPETIEEAKEAVNKLATTIKTKTEND